MKNLKVITIILFLIIFDFGCKLSMSYELISQIPSPDSSAYVYVYSVNAGATSGYSYRVTVSDKNNFEKINKEKYFFNFDSNHGKAADNVNLEWLDDKAIKIEYDENARVYTQKHEFEKFSITYCSIPMKNGYNVEEIKYGEKSWKNQ